MFHLNGYTVGCHLQTQKLEQLTKQTVLCESTARGSILKKATWQNFILKLKSYTKKDVTIIIIIIVIIIIIIIIITIIIIIIIIIAVRTSGYPE